MASSVLLFGGAFACFDYYFGGWAAIRFGRAVNHLLKPGCMNGKVVVVTGANSGIGLDTVRELSRVGATVVLCCRNRERGEKAAATLSPEERKNVTVMDLDLSSSSSIQNFAQKFQATHSKLDVYIMNAGVAGSFVGTQGFKLGKMGFEEHIESNYLGHFMLTKLLLPTLRATPGARVISASSVAACMSYQEGINVSSWTTRHPKYSDWQSYSQSKLAMLLFAQQLQEREPSLLCVAAHPGVVDGTGLMHPQSSSIIERIYDKFIWTFIAMRSSDGCKSYLYLALEDREKLRKGGMYFPVGRQMSQFPWSAPLVALWRSAMFIGPSIEMRHERLWDETEEALKQVKSG